MTYKFIAKKESTKQKKGPRNSLSLFTVKIYLLHGKVD